ncbi:MULTISPECIES: hypothetical protein [unclassified Nonomuraea]|uniref:hypothetical protein n=1 Tax=unclassified Nonomuraea TaxID=2593643 RepID=UPI0033F9107E
MPLVFGLCLRRSKYGSRALINAVSSSDGARMAASSRPVVAWASLSGMSGQARLPSMSRGAVGAALHSALVDLVVEGESVAEFACGLGEAGGLLVGVGAVDDGEGGREPELGQGFEGGDGVGADAFVWGVEDQSERQLWERAADRGGGAGGDGEGGAVAVLGWATACGVVPTRGDLGGGDQFAGGAAHSWWAGEDRGGGGVDADVAAESFHVAAAFAPADGGEDERGDDVLQQLLLAGVVGVVVFPGVGEQVGLVLRQAGSPVVPGRVQQAGEPVEGSVETSVVGQGGVRIGGVWPVGAEPEVLAGRDGQGERRQSPGFGQGGLAGVVDRDHEADEHRPDRHPDRSWALSEFGVDRCHDLGVAQQSGVVVDDGVGDLHRLLDRRLGTGASGAGGARRPGAWLRRTQSVRPRSSATAVGWSRAGTKGW